MSDAERTTAHLWYGSPRLAHPDGGYVTVHLPMPAGVAGEALGKLADAGFELLRIRAIGWKDEDNINGEPFGKAWAVYADDSTVQAPMWLSITEARAVAERLEVPLYEE